MLLLDPADVPLHLAKMSKYLHDARVPPGGARAAARAAGRCCGARRAGPRARAAGMKL